MEERFEIFIRKYGVKSKEQFLHIYEAILFMFSSIIDTSKGRSRRKKKDKLPSQLSVLNIDDLLGYL